MIKIDLIFGGTYLEKQQEGAVKNKDCVLSDRDTPTEMCPTCCNQREQDRNEVRFDY